MGHGERPAAEYRSGAGADRDGFLWLGTEAGLVRFDGVEFQTYDRNSNPALPGNDIRCLLESRDGALWIGTNAGLARWKDGAVTAFTTRDGLPGNGILTLGEGEDGKLRVWTEQGPAQQAGDQFVPVKTRTHFLAPRSLHQESIPERRYSGSRCRTELLSRATEPH